MTHRYYVSAQGVKVALVAALLASVAAPVMAQPASGSPQSSFKYTDSTTNLTASSTFTGSVRSPGPFSYFTACVAVGSYGGTLNIYTNSSASNSGGSLLASSTVSAGSGQCLKVPFTGPYDYLTYVNGSGGTTTGLIISSEVTAN